MSPAPVVDRVRGARLRATRAMRHKLVDAARSARVAAVVSAAVLVAQIAVSVPAHAQDTMEPVVLVRPTQVDLGSGSRAIELWVENAPETVGFQLELSFDAALVAVTAAEAGDFLSSTGGAVVLKPRLPDTGNLTLSGSVVLEEGVSHPAGDGMLASVTLAPLAMGEASPLTLSNVVLHVPEGDVPVERLVDGSVVVSLEPPESVQAEAVAQATAMAESLGGASAALPALPDLSEYGSEIIWIGLFLLAVAVVVVGWIIGRRPPGGGDDEFVAGSGPYGT